MIVQIIVISLMTFDFITYLKYVGDADHLIQFINNQQFDTQLIASVAIPCSCTIYWFAKTVLVKLNHDRQGNNKEPPIFSLQALNYRLKIFSSYEHFRPFRYGTLLFIAPLMNILLLILIHIKVKYAVTPEIYQWEKCVNIMTIFRAGEISAMFFYGWFTFLVYINRVKYHSELKDIVDKFVNENYDIDQCKYKITEKWLAIQEYRRVVGWWLCYSIVLGVLSVVTVIMWLSSTEFKDEMESNLLNAAIICRETMWFIQPLLAAGGFDVDNIWRDFQHECVKNFHKANKQQLLESVLDYTRKICSKGLWVYTTIVFAGLSVFAAIVEPDQFVEIWIRPRCNVTTNSSSLVN